MGWGVPREFCLRSFHVLPATGADARLWSSTSPTRLSPFLDPANPNRYIVVSVDPAGGGVLSDEAFIVFMVADTEFGLLTGRLVPGHSGRYGFAMIPLVFVVALLKTIRGVVRMLREAYDASVYVSHVRRQGDVPPPFVVPPVLVFPMSCSPIGVSVCVCRRDMFSVGP